MKHTLNRTTALLLIAFAFACSDSSLLDEPVQRADEANSAGRRNTRSFTIVAVPSTNVTEAPVELRLVSPEPAEVVVDWGDGTTTSYTFEQAIAGYAASLSHFYPEDVEYVISVTGDLDKITALENSSYDVLGATAINVDGLRNLESFFMGFNDFTTIDLFHNRKLTSIGLDNNMKLQNVVLSRTHGISLVDLNGSVSLSTSAVNGIIDNIYWNAVRKNITGGRFTLDAGGVGPTGEFVGPPTGEYIEKLNILSSDYGWYVEPGGEM